MSDHELPAAPSRVERDTATAKTLITGALLAELGRRLYEYENTITWNTTCTSCAAVLDSSIRETVRREHAEAKLAAILNLPALYVGTVAEGNATVSRADILAIIGTEGGGHA